MLVKASFHFLPDERLVLLDAILELDAALLDLPGELAEGRGEIREVLTKARKRIDTMRNPRAGIGTDWSPRVVQELFEAFAKAIRMCGKDVIDEEAPLLLEECLEIAKIVEQEGDEWSVEEDWT